MTASTDRDSPVRQRPRSRVLRRPVGRVPLAARRGAVFWDPVQELWVVSRYDDVMAIEKDGARVLVVLRVRARRSTSAPTAR